MAGLSVISVVVDLCTVYTDIISPVLSAILVDVAGKLIPVLGVFRV